MSWFEKHLEPIPAHLAYLILSAFLLTYALFSSLIRNTLHLSEPPLALLLGILFGPAVLNILNPTQWGLTDNITQEAARVIVGLQLGCDGLLCEGCAGDEVDDCVGGECVFGAYGSGAGGGGVGGEGLRFAEKWDYIDPASFLVFYFLLAIFSIGIGSTLGVDDFLAAFGAGYGFAWDGWFAKKTKETHLPNILDLILNSSMFVYFGAIIPWSHFTPGEYTQQITPGRLIALLVLILLFRRIPIVLAMKPFIPDIKTYREALFCGHFGPMGLGALFLVIEARAQLENGTSQPEPHPPKHTKHKEAIETIWPVVSFIILGSTMVHGLSVAAISVGSHYSRKEGERAPLIGQETNGLHYMVHEGGGGESEPSVSGDEDPQG
ncbi:hypothetical protein JMJ35_001422 [Cladonia borealis]|uniref:Cation/H+ exchanger transmembrane domain-containing protein n=1 Tax=Cladonia borealis TaxID=184061 RepID=A0AA39RAN1_9LECA|nr:hypothetical protein JMJ35_001422 [Cladonia borealis]